MKKSLKKIALAAGALVATSLFIVGCSNNQSSGKTQVTMATVGTTKPFSYADKKGELTGFDIELARAIFKDSDKYQLNFQKVDGNSQYVGLDSGKYQMLGNNTSYTAERAKKYLYSLPTASTPSVLVVPKNSTISKYDDIAGHSTQVIAGTTTAQQLEDFNKSHSDNPVSINYTNENITKILHNVNDGQYDFKIFDAPSVKSIIEDQGLTNLKTVELSSAEKPYIYYVFAKGNEDLQKFVNKRIKELYKDGTISKLAKKYLGGDYVPDKADIDK